MWKELSRKGAALLGCSDGPKSCRAAYERMLFRFSAQGYARVDQELYSASALLRFCASALLRFARRIREFNYPLFYGPNMLTSHVAMLDIFSRYRSSASICLSIYIYLYHLYTISTQFPHKFSTARAFLHLWYIRLQYMSPIQSSRLFICLNICYVNVQASVN
jgi:hypothetical protein